MLSFIILFFDLGFILLIRFGYVFAMLKSILLTINTCTDNIVDEEFAHFMTADEISSYQYKNHYHMDYDEIDWGDDD